MEQVLQYEIPVIHPIAVHFPFVLVLLALVFGLIWLVRDRVHWLRLACGIQFLGLAGAGVAYLSGDVMKEQSEGVPIVDELVPIHETAAFYALLAIGVSVVLLLGAWYLHFRNSSHPGTPFWVRMVCFLALLLAALLIVWTAHIGGTMVWGVAS